MNFLSSFWITLLTFWPVKPITENWLSPSCSRERERERSSAVDTLWGDSCELRVESGLKTDLQVQDVWQHPLSVITLSQTNKTREAEVHCFLLRMLCFSVIGTVGMQTKI